MATIKYWNGSAWELAIVGKQGPAGATGPTGPAGSASLQRFRFVATGGQTSVSGTDANGNTLAYTPGLEEVFINGAAQVRGQDYTATNGTSITGIGALLANDVVEILAWGVFDVANTISNTLIDAKGDILAGSAADTVSRLAVGANNTVLTADSSTATGLKWAAPSSGPTGYTLLNSGGTTLTGSSVTISSISAKKLAIFVEDASPNTAGTSVRLYFNNDQTSKYKYLAPATIGQSTYSTGIWSWENSIGSYSPSLNMGYFSNNASSQMVVWAFVDLADQTGIKSINYASSASAGGSSGMWSFTGSGFYEGTSAITSVTVRMDTGNFDGGKVYVYGAN